MQAIKEARMLRSRRYTNRRLGEFLKELDLTEGRATGIPTIQQKLRENGQSRATIETDEERTFFLIDIPCNPDSLGGPILKGDMKDDMKGDMKDDMKNFSEIRILRDDFHIMKRVGGRKDGYWVIIQLIIRYSIEMS